MNEEQKLALGNFVAVVHNLRGTPKSAKKDEELMTVIMNTRGALLALGMSHKKALQLLKDTVRYVCSEQGQKELNALGTN